MGRRSKKKACFRRKSTKKGSHGERDKKRERGKYPAVDSEEGQVRPKRESRGPI